jgi:hypothetical protein
MTGGAVAGLAATIAAAALVGSRTATVVFLLALVLVVIAGRLLVRGGRALKGPRDARRGLRLWFYGLLGLGAAGAALAGAYALDQADRARSPAAERKSDGVSDAPRELVVRRTSKRLGPPDPLDRFWEDVPQWRVVLIAQPMIAPRPEKTRTESILVQAVHDGRNIAFRIVWDDPDLSEGGRIGEHSDALAIQFPSDGTDTTPVWMGSRHKPVHIYHWRAQYQRDHEQGKPTMRDLYPNIAIDMYPMDFKYAPGGTEEEKQSFSPGFAEGNPQSHPKESVDEIIAEGFATSALMEGHSGAARGVWEDGQWALVITRPLAVQGGSRIRRGGVHYVAFAAWQGGENEVGARKSVTMTWLPIRVSRG